MARVVVDPIPRIEGHLRIEVEVENGKVKDARQNFSVIMIDRDAQDVARWDFTNAWPSKVSGPSVKSDSNEFGIEEVTIVHEGLMRKS